MCTLVHIYTDIHIHLPCDSSNIPISVYQPFWPMGTGCARGFMGVFDTVWMVSLREYHILSSNIPIYSTEFISLLTLSIIIVYLLLFIFYSLNIKYRIQNLYLGIGSQIFIDNILMKFYNIILYKSLFMHYKY